MLGSLRELADGDVTIRVGSGEAISEKVVGVARLNFRNKFLAMYFSFLVLGEI